MDSGGEVAPFSKCLPLEKLELPITTDNIDSQQQQAIDEPIANPDQEQINESDTNILDDSAPQHEGHANFTTTTNPQNQNNNNKSDNLPTTNTTELYISPPMPKKEYSPIRLNQEYVAKKEKAMSLLLKKDVPFGKYKPSKKSSIICEVLVSEVETVKTNKETGV